MESTQPSIKQPSLAGESLLPEYARLLSRFVALAAGEGVAVQAFAERGAPWFLTLPLASRRAVIERVELYLGICQAVAADGYGMADDRRMLWATLKRLKLRPASDLFQMFRDDDIIEVYLVPEFVQVFRSFRFLSLCSYSLDELLSRPWWELYFRDEQVTARVMETVMSVASSPTPTLQWYDIGPHAVDERESSGLFSSIQDLRFVAPLLDESHRVGGIVNVVRPLSVVPGRGERAGRDILKDRA